MAGTLSGCSGKSKSSSSTEGAKQHSEFKKVANYLYEVTYSSYEENFETARSYFDKYKLGGCSSVQNGYIRGRNYDWTLDDSVEFVIHVLAANGRHASVGIAALTAITMEQMDAGNVDKELLAIAPYITLDGINDAGLAININVVSFGEKGEWTMRTEKTEDDLCPLMVPRLVLDQCGSIDEALGLIKSKDVFSLSTLDEAHFMISGP